MTDNGTDPSPTSPARQQANRILLAEDMRSGIYRQCEGDFTNSMMGPAAIAFAPWELLMRLLAAGNSPTRNSP